MALISGPNIYECPHNRRAVDCRVWIRVNKWMGSKCYSERTAWHLIDIAARRVNAGPAHEADRF